MVIAKDSSKTFKPVPAGNHQAVCYDVWDIKVQEVEYNNVKKYQHKIIVGWELSKLNENGKRYRVSKKYTLSLSDKATLTKDLEGWTGKSLTKEDKLGIDVDTMITKNCILNVIHKEYEGKEFAIISSVGPLIEGMVEIKAETERSTPEWIEKLINKASYQAMDEVPDVVEEDI